MDQTQNESSWMDDIIGALASLDHREEKPFISSILSVSSKLRKHNEEAYSPKLVTIGPIHRGTSSHLLAMEEHKWSYTLAFFHRTSNPVSTLKECGTVILGLDDAVRASYGGNIKYHPHELAKIMLRDGCFLLELLLRRVPQQMVPRVDYSSDPIVGHQKMLSSILTDLSLLENQIPFFVLKALARILQHHVFRSQDDHLVANLTLSLFSDPTPSLFSYPLKPCPGVAHFLHLMHLSSITREGQEVKQAQQELKRCATRLGATGITLRPVDRHSKLFHRFGFEIRFVKGVLEIPPLHVGETTEVYLRNFIAWEQSRNDISRQFTSYALFLRGLICSMQDIELLVSNGVLVKDTKISNEDLLTFFRTITKEVDQMDSSYSKLCEDLSTYSAVNPLKKFPILVWHYCRRCVDCIIYSCNLYSLIKFLSRGYNFVAAILSLLSVVQAIYAVLSYHYPKH